MLDAIRRLFGYPPRERTTTPPRTDAEMASVRIATAALLLESALADDRMDPAERVTIERQLATGFGLDDGQVRALIIEAESARAASVDLHGFTSVLVRRFDRPRRRAIAEQIWSVMFADGRLTDRESVLARRLGYLLELRPAEVSTVMRRARAARASGTRV